jgi:hypothetical protein
VLAGGHTFPHAFIDRAGEWRIPVADVDAHIRWRTVRRAGEAVREDVAEDV